MLRLLVEGLYESPLRTIHAGEFCNIFMLFVGVLKESNGGAKALVVVHLEVPVQSTSSQKGITVASRDGYINGARQGLYMIHL